MVLDKLFLSEVANKRSGFSKNREQIVRDYIPLRDAVMEVYREQFANGDWQNAATTAACGV